MLIIDSFGFNLNPNLFETNLLNLLVVFGVLVAVVGDGLRTLLKTRQQSISVILGEADRKEREAREQLEEARHVVANARWRARTLRSRSLQRAEQAKLALKQQVRKDLQRSQEQFQKAVQGERQKTVGAFSRDRMSNLIRSTEGLYDCLVCQANPL